MYRTGFRILCVSLVVCGLFAGTAHAQTLVWSDEFDGPPSGRYCCGNGVLEGPEGDGRCDGNP